MRSQADWQLEVDGLKAALDVTREQLHFDQNQLNKIKAKLDMLGVPTNGAGGHGKREELDQAQRLEFYLECRKLA